MYSTLVITPESVDYAIQKLNNFKAVNHPGDYDQKMDALEMFCQSLGINDDITDVLFEHAFEQYGEGASHIFVGALIGLAIAEHGLENYKQNDD